MAVIQSQSIVPTDETTPGTASPFLRWAGSKRAVLGQLLRAFPEKFHTYIEPFAGSACIFFKIDPQRAVLNDLNRELIETYEIVRVKPVEIGNFLQKMPVGKEEFYTVRNLDPATLPPVERASRFIYLNRFCFNGLYRTNNSGKFNVPYGAPKNHRVPTASDLEMCAHSLEKATLVSGDFEAVVRKNAKRGDLVYLDPPFYRQKVRVFREYNSEPFAAADFERLVALLIWLDSKGIKFCVSYADCKEAKVAFAGWPSFRINTNRNISGFAQHRRKARELVITNYEWRR